MLFGDVLRLRAFVLVLDLGSISAAASALGYTQSAVSQQLATLEREAGIALVDRSQRPVVLRARRGARAPPRRHGTRRSGPPAGNARGRRTPAQRRRRRRSSAP